MGEGAPAAPAPTAGPAAERSPSEWSSLNIHFMAAAKKGRSRLSEPRSSANQPQQQRRRRRRRLHGRRDFRLPEPSNREGRGFRRRSPDTASKGVSRGGAGGGLEGYSAEGRIERAIGRSVRDTDDCRESI